MQDEESDYGMGMIDAMLSSKVPMSDLEEKLQNQEEMKKVEGMKSDTQILLAIFEKVVCIEEKMEHMQEAEKPSAQPDPSVFGTTSFQLEM